MSLRHVVRNRLLALSCALLLAACGDHDVVTPLSPPSAPRATLAAGPNDVSDGQGTAWRQLTETVGLTWSQVAAVCPQDGVSPCTGNVGTTALKGWVWATDEQVVQLISRYEPEILNSRSLSGPAYDAGVARFFLAFKPTNAGGCFGTGYIASCSFGSHVSGWTSTSAAYGTAVSAIVQSGFFAPSMITIASDGSINTPSSTRGLFLWRPDGSGNSGIEANDDAGYIDSPSTGVVVANVLANDVLAGNPATLSTVRISTVSSTSPALVLNAADGSVSITDAMRVGDVSLTYRICELARPSNCDDAIVRVSVRGDLIDANEDQADVKTGGGIAIANVLANDTYAGAVATLASVTLSATSTDAALTLSPDGAVTIAAGASLGLHQMTYQICQIGNAINCDDAAIKVRVSNYAVRANDDKGTAPQSRGGVAVASVLANDTFEGAPTSLAMVSLSLVTTPSAGISFDATDGSVRVAAGTLPGTSSFVYRICERAYASNCAQATVTVTIAPQVYVISKDRQRMTEGSGGSFGVSLGQQPNGNVTVNVAYLAGGMNITASPATVTFTPSNWSTSQSVSFNTSKDSNKDDNAGTLSLTSAGIATGYVVVSGVDSDRKGSTPSVTIQSPFNGQTVSGMVNFWGSATANAGTLVDAKFYVESNRIATTPNAGGNFRMGTWNSATVPNGWHTLEMRVSDSAGNETRSQILVYVNN